MSPPELVSLLNTVFTTFDGFVEELGLEKIKTVGDAYMVASGVPHSRPDHANAIAELARADIGQGDVPGHGRDCRCGTRRS